MDEIGQWPGRTQLRPFRAVCQQSRRQGAVCPWRQLGPGIRDLDVSLTRLCDDRTGALYVCNRTLTPACDDLCDRSFGPQTLSLKDLQSYLDSIVSRNPFGGDLEPWDVPQVDLTEPEAYVFVSQRQALYTALRTLALKLRDPTSQALAQGFEASLNVARLDLGTFVAFLDGDFVIVHGVLAFFASSSGGPGWLLSGASQSDC
eukprot:s513_g4.t3